jgi:hypothetical protein
MTAEPVNREALAEEAALVKTMLDRMDAARGKGGYPSALERYAMRKVHNGLVTLLSRPDAERAEGEAGKSAIWRGASEKLLDEVQAAIQNGDPASVISTEALKNLEAALDAPPPPIPSSTGGEEEIGRVVLDQVKRLERFKGCLPNKAVKSDFALEIASVIGSLTRALSRPQPVAETVEAGALVEALRELTSETGNAIRGMAMGVAALEAYDAARSSAHGEAG